MIPKRRKQTWRVLFASMMGPMRWVTAVERYHLLQIPGEGAVAVFRDSPVLMYSGRVLLPPKSEEHAARLRRRSVIVVARQEDPSPLVLAAGHDRHYRGEVLTEEGEAKITSDVISFSRAEHAAEGSVRDRVTFMLAVALGAGLVVMGLTWLSIPLLRLVRG